MLLFSWLKNVSTLLPKVNKYLKPINYIYIHAHQGNRRTGFCLSSVGCYETRLRKHMKGMRTSQHMVMKLSSQARTGSENQYAFYALRKIYRTKLTLTEVEMNALRSTSNQNLADIVKQCDLVLQSNDSVKQEGNQLYHQISQKLKDVLPKISKNEYFNLMVLLSHVMSGYNILQPSYSVRKEIASTFYGKFLHYVEAKSITYDHVFKLGILLYSLKDHHRFSRDFMHWLILTNQKSTFSALDIPSVGFFMNCFRKDMPKTVSIEIENTFYRHIDEMGIDETALVCLGFFKCWLIFTNMKLVNAIASKLADNLDDVTDISLGAIIKQLRLSSTRVTCNYEVNRKHVSTLLRSLSGHITLFQPSTVVHVLWYSYKLSYLNQDLINAVCCDLMGRKEKILELRLKDLARLLFTLGQFQCRSGDVLFYQMLVDDLSHVRHEVAIKQFPSALVTALVGLGLLQIFPHQLIDQILNETYPKEQVSGYRRDTRIDLARDLYQISESVKIVRPDYIGQTLPHNFLSSYPQSHEIHGRQGANREHCQTKIVEEVQHMVCQVLGGSQYFKTHFILPHFQIADIEIHLDHDGNAVEVNQWQSDGIAHNNTIKTKDSYIRLALLINTPNCFFTVELPDGTTQSRLRGQVSAKIHQLVCLGYTVHQIDSDDMSCVKLRKFIEHFLMSGNRGGQCTNIGGKRGVPTAETELG